MGKRARRRSSDVGGQRAADGMQAPTTTYADAEAGELELRGSLTPKARSEYAETLAGGLNREDAWQRATELLFERLAVSWTVSDVRTDRQKELLGALPDGECGRAPLRPRQPARARQRELPGAGGTLIDADAFAVLIADWCLEVKPGQQILIETTTLAAERRQRCIGQCSNARHGRCCGSRRPDSRRTSTGTPETFIWTVWRRSSWPSSRQLTQACGSSRRRT